MTSDNRHNTPQCCPGYFPARAEIAPWTDLDALKSQVLEFVSIGYNVRGAFGAQGDSWGFQVAHFHTGFLPADVVVPAIRLVRGWNQFVGHDVAASVAALGRRNSEWLFSFGRSGSPSLLVDTGTRGKSHDGISKEGLLSVLETSFEGAEISVFFRLEAHPEHPLNVLYGGLWWD